MIGRRKEEERHGTCQLWSTEVIVGGESLLDLFFSFSFLVCVSFFFSVFQRKVKVFFYLPLALDTYSSASQHLFSCIYPATASWAALSFGCFQDDTWFQACTISYWSVTIPTVFFYFIGLVLFVSKFRFSLACFSCMNSFRPMSECISERVIWDLRIESFFFFVWRSNYFVHNFDFSIFWYYFDLMRVAGKRKNRKEKNCINKMCSRDNCFIF